MSMEVPAEQPPAVACGWCGGDIAPDAPRAVTECCGPMHLEPAPDGPLSDTCHAVHTSAKRWEEDH